MFVRLVTVTAFLIAAAFFAQVFFGSLIARASQEETSAVSARAVYRDGKFDVRGMVMVPSSCHRLSVRPHEIDPQTTALVFETWEEPYRYTHECVKESTPRSFQLEVFGTAGTEFRAMLDTKWVRLSLARTE
jgi:hypothetical protein